MNQARPRAWGRQARNDLELAEMASGNVGLGGAA